MSCDVEYQKNIDTIERDDSFNALDALNILIDNEKRTRNIDFLPKVVKPIQSIMFIKKNCFYKAEHISIFILYVNIIRSLSLNLFCLHADMTSTPYVH
jgi:hypothetical protein